MSNYRKQFLICDNIKMSATTVHKFITFIGLLSILHAAYSAAQHRSYLRITEQEFTTLPIDILIQGIASLFMVMYGVMYIAGDFKEIRAVVDLENKSWETLRNLPSFQIFNHRGRSLRRCNTYESNAL
ncbi:Membrane magnesium transporter 1 [Habropoda laboriosa]|uniref:Membrane magnesium transporter n=1 Tax=Habropoda laboriosa TaxID=597456 RepID=A0A0L7QXM4_9HYME|nr:PREDICTED: membrane magnesium transporter 1 [Habropoda laboriosa]KOC63309.1 Membrane magnesium transporter 1 [Habropoda laboriosa]